MEVEQNINKKRERAKQEVEGKREWNKAQREGGELKL